MEDLSRRALLALFVGAAGPAAALVTFLLVGPVLVAATAPETEGGIVETTGSLLLGLLLGGAITSVIAYLVALGATFFALRATGCPAPHVALLVCGILSFPWLGLLSSLDVDLTAFLLLAGVLPFLVRLGAGGWQGHGRPMHPAA